MRLFAGILIVLLLTACGDEKDSPTPQPTFTSAPTATAAPAATASLPDRSQSIIVATSIPAPDLTPEFYFVITATPLSIPATEAVEATATTAPTQTPPAATTNDAANLRAGPGTEFPVVGNVAEGQTLTIVGRTSANDWYQLGDGSWIAAFLVTGAPSDVAVSEQASANTPMVATSTPEVPEEQPAALVAEPAKQSTACTAGCVQQPDPSCVIKGNSNGNNGDKIYHLPDDRWYEKMKMNAEEGDLWFCTVEEAETAGFRGIEK